MTLPTDKNAIANAFRESIPSIVAYGSEVSHAQTDCCDMVWQLILQERVCTKILQTKGTIFSLIKSKSGKNVRMKMTPFAYEILQALNPRLSGFQQQFTRHKFHPAIVLFNQHAQNQNLRTLNQKLPDWVYLILWERLNAFDLDYIVKRLNAFIHDLRKDGNSAKFKNQLKNYTRPIDENYKEVCKYIDNLLMKHNEFLVVCLDLGYKKIKGWPHSIDTSITFDDVRLQLKQFLKYLHKKFGSDLYGFAYHIENELFKGFNTHFILLLNPLNFLNPQGFHDPHAVVKTIGEQWDNITTAGKGLHYDCNMGIDYRSRTTGILHRYDATLIAEFKETALLYLTKIDYYVKYAPPGNARIFHKGQIPKDKKQTTKKTRTKNVKIDCDYLKRKLLLKKSHTLRGNV